MPTVQAREMYRAREACRKPWLAARAIADSLRSPGSLRGFSLR
jgi:hypothetical protein